MYNWIKLCLFRRHNFNFHLWNSKIPSSNWKFSSLLGLTFKLLEEKFIFQTSNLMLFHQYKCNLIQLCMLKNNLRCKQFYPRYHRVYFRRNNKYCWTEKIIFWIMITFNCKSNSIYLLHKKILSWYFNE